MTCIPCCTSLPGFSRCWPEASFLAQPFTNLLRTNGLITYGGFILDRYSAIHLMACPDKKSSIPVFAGFSISGVRFTSNDRIAAEAVIDFRHPSSHVKDD